MQDRNNSLFGFADYISARTQDFTGRDWVFDAINVWLADKNGARVFLLTGEPGCGKSAIASRLVQVAQGTADMSARCASLQPDFLSAFHFCSARAQTWINSHTFTRSLALQLADRYPVYAEALADLSGDEQIHIQVRQTTQQIRDQGKQIGVYIENLDVSRLSAEDAFVRTVREPLAVLAAQQPDARIVILVDALDEALVYTGQSSIVDLLARTAALPSNVRFLLTSRQEPRVESEFWDADGLFVSADRFSSENRGDVHQFVQGQLMGDSDLKVQTAQRDPNELQNAVTTIVDKADGNFRYITFLLREMVSGQRKLSDLSGLPTGLDGLYYESLNRLVRQGKKNWRNDYAPIFGILAVAQDVLTLPQLTALTSQDEEVLWGHLTDLQQFVEEVTRNDTDDPEFVYRLYHQSVADFLGRHHIQPKRKRINNPFYLNAESWHQQIADYYWSTYHDNWHLCDPYGLKSLVAHQIACLPFFKNSGDNESQTGNLYSVILDAEFQRAQRDKLGDGKTTLNDLRGVLDVALQNNAIVPVMKCVGAYRDMIRRANLIQAFFEAVDEQSFDIAQSRLSTYLSISDWGAVAHLYLAWEAALAGDVAAVAKAIRSAQKLPTVNAERLSDALCVCCARMLSQRVTGEITAKDYLGQWGWNKEMPRLVESNDSPTLAELSRLDRRLDKLTKGRWFERRRADAVGHTLVQLVTREDGRVRLDKLLQETLGDPYPPYRDIGLVQLGIACASVSDTSWMRARLRKILAVTLDSEGMIFTFDLPAVLALEARARGWEATALATMLYSGLVTNDRWGTDERANLALAGALFRQGESQKALNAMTQKMRPSQASAGYATLTVLAMIDRCFEMGHADIAIEQVWRNSHLSLIEEAAVQAQTVYDPPFKEQRNKLVTKYCEWGARSLSKVTQIPIMLNVYQDNDTRMAYINHLAARWAGMQEGPNLPALKSLIVSALNDGTTLDALLARFIGLNLNNLNDDELNEVIRITEKSLVA